ASPGTWTNAQRPPSLLAALALSPSGGSPSLRADAVEAPGVSAPGAFEVGLLTDGVGTAEPTKVRGSCRLGQRDVHFHGWVKQGVLVLAYFVRFPAGDDRSDYFDREVFYREG